MQSCDTNERFKDHYLIIEAFFTNIHTICIDSYSRFVADINTISLKTMHNSWLIAERNISNIIY